MTPTRRSFLLSSGAACCAGLCGIAAASCMSSPGAASQCTEASQGSDPTHCLVEPAVIRVTGANTLTPGQAVLTNVDDNTAVIVARDARGLHALSAICTHACCVVSLCTTPTCSGLTPTPDTCQSTQVAEGDAEGTSILCPCHGATFRLADGTALAGPTSTPLPSYDLTVDGDDVLVDTGTEVPASLRV